jgi:hypothetical protein
VAFATTALAEFMHMRKFGTTNTTTDLSEQVRVGLERVGACSARLGSQASGNMAGLRCLVASWLQDLLECTVGDGCHGQQQVMYAEFIACNGIATEADQPYTATNDADDCKPVPRYSAIAAENGGESLPGLLPPRLACDRYPAPGQPSAWVLGMQAATRTLRRTSAACARCCRQRP